MLNPLGRVAPASGSAFSHFAVNSVAVSDSVLPFGPVAVVDFALAGPEAVFLLLELKAAAVAVDEPETAFLYLS